jgi:hypothetical protein
MIFILHFATFDLCFFLHREVTQTLIYEKEEHIKVLIVKVSLFSVFLFFFCILYQQL